MKWGSTNHTFWVDKLLNIVNTYTYMSELTRNINALLDEINDIKSNKSITDDSVENIITDLNKITNNGLNVNDIFTNNYYVNDMGEDRRCASGKIYGVKYTS